MLAKASIPQTLPVQMLAPVSEFMWRRKNEIHYIGGSEVLPAPLEPEKEAQAIESLVGETSAQARELLIEHNLRLVVYLAKKYESTGYPLEDLVSIGSIGLIKGINTYKIDKNIKLATYASRCIANEILMYIRKNKRRKTEISLEDALNYDSEGNELHLEDVMGTDSDLVADEYESKEEKVLLERELKNLDSRDKEIMIMRYGLYNTKEYTQKEVADKLSISQSYISRIEKKVIKKLKTLLRFG